MDDLLARIRDRVSGAVGSRAFPIASEIAVGEAEAELRLAIPTLLRRSLLEVGNGGFGPSDGIIGVAGGHRSDYGDIVETYQVLRRDYLNAGVGWAPDVLPFCGWGCAIVSCVRCDGSLQILTLDEGKFWPQSYTLSEFFEFWLAGVDILSLDENVETVDLAVRNPFTGKNQTVRSRRRKS